MIDILLFAILAAFLIYRLYDILGTGDDDTPSSSRDWGAKFNEHEKESHENTYVDTNPKDGIDQKIRNYVLKIDPKFSLDEFVDGACHAYEAILRAFSEDDRLTLRKLLSDDLFSEFDKVMKEREKKSFKQKLLELNINSVLVEDITVKANKIIIRVVFLANMQLEISEQTESFEQKISNKSEEMDDTWTFSSDQKRGWVLIETE